MLNKSWKKLAVLFLIFTLIFTTFVACSNDDEPEVAEEAEEVVEETEEAEEAEEAEEPIETLTEEERAFRDGERVALDPATAESVIKGETVTAEYIPFEEPFGADTFDGEDIEYIDGRLYTLVDDKLYAFNMNEDLLVLDEEYGGKGYIDIDMTGDVFLSHSSEGILFVSSKGSYRAYDSRGSLVSDESGTSAMFRINPETDTGAYLGYDEIGLVSIGEYNKITFEEPLITDDEVFDWTNDVHLYGDKIYIATSIVIEGTEDTYHGMGVVDMEGNIVQKIGGIGDDDPGHACYADSLMMTKAGLMLVDCNCKQFIFFEEDGTYVDLKKFDAMTPLDYPWPSGTTRVDDDTILFMGNVGRKDDTGKELLIISINGL